MVFRLSQLVEEIGGIVVLVRELPASDLGREVISILGEATEAEDLALRKLRNRFGRVESGQEEQGLEDVRRGWRPFDLKVYRDLEARRNTAPAYFVKSPSPWTSCWPDSI